MKSDNKLRRLLCYDWTLEEKAMETLSFSAISISPTLSAKPHKTRLQTSFSSSKFSISPHNKSCLTHSVYALSSSSCISISTARTSAASTTLSSTKTENRHWMVIMERPPQELNTKQEIVDYYAKTLERVLGRWVRFECFVLRSAAVFLLDFESGYCLVGGFVQWKGCSDLYIWCFLWYQFRVLLWHRWRNFCWACSYVFSSLYYIRLFW